MIPLKSQMPDGSRRTSEEVAAEVGCCEVVVNIWMKRYQQQGMDGLKTKAGSGRKSILQVDTDLAAVREAVQSSRQRISLAKAELQQELTLHSGTDRGVHFNECPACLCCIGT